MDALPDYIEEQLGTDPLKADTDDDGLSDYIEVAIDYDPGATRVNQENRIKLMLAVAKENLDNELKEQQSRSNIKKVTLNTGSKHSKKEAVGV